MKKLAIALAAAFIAVGAAAQPGITAGLTSTSTDFNEAWANVNEVTQYHVGVTFKLPLPLGFAVQPSILYNVKGATLEDTATEGNLKSVDYKTGFLEVPVQVQWGINIAGAVRPYGFVEPFVGYGITNEEKISNFTGENSKDAWGRGPQPPPGFRPQVLEHRQPLRRERRDLQEFQGSYQQGC